MIARAMPFLLTLLLAATDPAPPPPGHWVVDLTGALTSDTIRDVEAISQALENSGQAQLGVLITRSTNGVAPRGYATGVFNRWGIGHRGRNDGLLLLIAVGDRKAEIILGSNSQLTPSQTDVVMRDQVVASMKRGDLNGATLSAAQALADLVNAAERPTEVVVAPRGPPSPTEQRLMRIAQREEPFPEPLQGHWVIDVCDRLNASRRAELDVIAHEPFEAGKGRLYFVLVDSMGEWTSPEDIAEKVRAQFQVRSALPMAIVVWDSLRHQGFIDVSLDATSPYERVQHQNAIDRMTQGTDETNALRLGGEWAAMVLTQGVPPRPLDDVVREGLEEHPTAAALTGGGGGLFGLAALSRYLRRRPRDCKTCGRARQRLGEIEDDQHLNDSQRREEHLKSVDHDVWWCGHCRDAIVLSYTAWLSSYSRCSGCNTRARSSSSTTLSHATEHSTGLERIDTHCHHCGNQTSSTRTTARLSSSSSSSSSSSFGGGSSSGSGSSGSW